MRASVIIPTLNSDKIIEPCLKSLEKQAIGCQNFEIIIVDGGSTDKTIEIVRRYVDHNRNIKLIIKKNCGISEARNIGADNSKSEILIFVDSDCIVPKNYIKNVVGLMKSKDIIAGDAISLKSKKVFERSVHLMDDILQNRILFQKVETAGELLNAAKSNNLAIKKSVFRKVNGFDERMGKNSIHLEDQELLFRLLKITNNFAYSKRNKVVHKRRDSVWSFAKQYYSRGIGWSYSMIKHRGRYPGKFYIFLSLFYFTLLFLFISSLFYLHSLKYFMYIFLLHLSSLFALQVLVFLKIKGGMFKNLIPWLLLLFLLFIRFLSTSVGIYIGMIKFSVERKS